MRQALLCRVHDCPNERHVHRHGPVSLVPGDPGEEHRLARRVSTTVHVAVEENLAEAHALVLAAPLTDAILAAAEAQALAIHRVHLLLLRHGVQRRQELGDGRRWTVDDRNYAAARRVHPPRDVDVGVDAVPHARSVHRRGEHVEGFHRGGKVTRQLERERYGRPRRRQLHGARVGRAGKWKPRGEIRPAHLVQLAVHVVVPPEAHHRIRVAKVVRRLDLEHHPPGALLKPEPALQLRQLARQHDDGPGLHAVRRVPLRGAVRARAEHAFSRVPPQRHRDVGAVHREQLVHVEEALAELVVLRAPVVVHDAQHDLRPVRGLQGHVDVTLVGRGGVAPNGVVARVVDAPRVVRRSPSGLLTPVVLLLSVHVHPSSVFSGALVVVPVTHAHAFELHPDPPTADRTVGFQLQRALHRLAREVVVPRDHDAVVRDGLTPVDLLHLSASARHGCGSEFRRSPPAVSDVCRVSLESRSSQQEPFIPK